MAPIYFKPHVVILSTVVEDTWPQAKELLKGETLRHEIWAMIDRYSPEFHFRRQRPVMLTRRRHDRS